MELREYIMYLLSNETVQRPVHTIDSLQSKPAAAGKIKNLSPKLVKYLSDLQEAQERLPRQFNNDCLLFDSVFESGNLLHADRIDSNQYNMYMQVDTNTKGHQQWFYFRVRNTVKNRKYLFSIMNFTKPGVTGGNGYKKD